MGLLDSFLQKQRDKVAEQVTADVATKVTKHVEGEILKAGSSSSSYMTGLTGGSTGAKRYQFSQDMVNGGVQSRKKPGANISFETLRRFSISHEISRACINFRKRQITGLEWGIVSTDEGSETINDADQKAIKDFFNTIGGRGIGYRRFLDRFIEDLMVLDAVALEKQATRNNSLHTVVPIDGATIRIRVDENGATPEPPEEAYVQVIRGQVTAQWTDDEMIYAMMNSRNDTPYGLAPLESLMIIVTSSLKAGMYNLAYLTDGNIPEGFFTMPDQWTSQNIKDFQEYWDAMLAGDESATRRLKFMPDGTYTPTTKPTDMAFEQFNDWLMHITCALFDVDPVSIGFSPKTGLNSGSAAKTQKDVGEDKGERPLALFIEEIFTKIIQEDLGYPNLRFDFPSLRGKDEKAQADLNASLINSGQRTIDEIRTDDGLQALPDGLGARPFVAGQMSYLQTQAESEANVQQPGNGTTTEEQLPDNNADGQKPEGNENKQENSNGKNPADDSTAKRNQSGSFDRVMSLRSNQISELRTFRKYAVNRKKSDKAIRPFVSAVLPNSMVEELNEHVTKADGLLEIRKAFDEPIKELEMLNVDTALEARNAVVNLV